MVVPAVEERSARPATRGGSGGQQSSASGAARAASGTAPGSGGSSARRLWWRSHQGRRRTDGSGGAALAGVTVFIAGDSTVSNYADTASPTDQAGWGQMLLGGALGSGDGRQPRAAGGRTALWTPLGRCCAGDLGRCSAGVTICSSSSAPTTAKQDGNLRGRRHHLPAVRRGSTTFKQHLLDYYITPARRAASLVVVLVTPPRGTLPIAGRVTFFGGYATAMRETR